MGTGRWEGRTEGKGQTVSTPLRKTTMSANEAESAHRAVN